MLYTIKVTQIKFKVNTHKLTKHNIPRHAHAINLVHFTNDVPHNMGRIKFI